MIPISTVLNLFFLVILKVILDMEIWPFVLISILGITISSIIDLINYVIFRKENIKVQKKFTNKIDGLLASIYRGIIEIGTLPYKAYVSIKAIVKTIYRMNITKEHLLEWTTAEEAEKKSKNDLLSTYKNMTPNVVFGILGLLYDIGGISSFYVTKNSVLHVGASITSPITGATAVFILIFSLIWLLTPFFMWHISKPNKEKKSKEKLNKNEIDYVKNIAEKTWNYFSEYMNKDENYLPPDNFQSSRREKIVHRTSSTNIGLGIMTIISAYDLKFIPLDKAISFIENMMDTIVKLDKWNGHLYNWYNTKTLKPLIPRYISTVDSGNFVRIHVHIKIFFSGKRKYSIQRQNKKPYTNY